MAKGAGTNKAELVDKLGDFALDHPEGWTISEAASGLKWPKHKVRQVIRDLRDLFGEDKDVNLVCEPDGWGEWVYRLTGKLDEARWWISNRIADSDRRIRTILAVNRSIVAATDGRTIEGKRARLTVKYLERLVEDLSDLDGSKVLLKNA